MKQISIILLTLFTSCSSNIKEVKKINYPIIFTMSGGTFGCNTKVLITSDTVFARNYLNENLDDTIAANAFNVDGCLFMGTTMENILYLPIVPETPEQIGVANHELLHTTISIMTWAGITLSDSSEEVYAYEMSYLSKQFYENIKGR